jgi:hypothetical protein
VILLEHLMAFEVLAHKRTKTVQEPGAIRFYSLRQEDGSKGTETLSCSAHGEAADIANHPTCARQSIGAASSRPRTSARAAMNRLLSTGIDI